MPRRQKKQEVKEGLAEWMGTYGDMVTLLLCFFVLLFSMSEVNVQKFQAVMDSIIESRGSIGVLEGGVKVTSGVKQLPDLKKVKDKTVRSKNKYKDKELEDIKSKLDKFVKENKLENKLKVEKTNNSVNINFLDNVLFDSGKAILKIDAKKLLDKVYKQINKFEGTFIKVEGHTDNIPISNERYHNNWELSAIRAIAVTTYFVDKWGHEPTTISAEGFGEYYPKDTNKTVKGRQKNRRVEIKILSQYSVK